MLFRRRLESYLEICCTCTHLATRMPVVKQVGTQGTTHVKTPGLHSLPWVHEGERFSVYVTVTCERVNRLPHLTFAFLFLKIEFREGHKQRMPVHCHWSAWICCSLLLPVWSGHQRGVLCALTGAEGAGISRMLLPQGAV